jgi:arabinogalactan endo-1,4-beta-galactosidase
MTIRLQQFDDAKSGNACDIHDVMQTIINTAPQGAKVAYTFPGYVSIVLPNGWEIAFGDSLEKDSGYSWNTFDTEGNSDYADAFDDLGDTDSIANKLWQQAAPVLEKAGL